MDRRSLGTSDLTVSEFGLGTMTFGAEADEATSHALLDRFVEVGGTLIDTADVYSQGASEEIIGRWLAGRPDRDHLVLATKGRFSMGDGPEDRGAGRAHLSRAVDASLRRLGVDVIDLYQVHAWDPATPLEETLGVLDDMVGAGKVRHVGVSNYTGWQLQRAVLVARHRGTAPIVSLQAQYSLLGREIEHELLPLCLEEGLGVLVWSPLAGGWLTGKYTPDDRPGGATRLGEDPTRGIEAYDLRNQPRTWEVLEVVRDIAASREVSMAQVALNWARARPGVAAVLLGVRTAGQLDDDLAALGWDLTRNEHDRLSAASAPGMPIYPHAFLEAYAGMDVWRRLGTRVALPEIGR
jgi:aryl-alcohol dehydrogenase (NADP+)